MPWVTDVSGQYIGYGVLEEICGLDVAGMPLFRYLVADTPHDHRGTVAVILYKIGKVLLGPLVK